MLDLTLPRELISQCSGFQLFRIGSRFTVDHLLKPSISKKECGRWAGPFDTPELSLAVWLAPQNWIC